MQSINESERQLTPKQHFNFKNKPKGILRISMALKNSLRALMWLIKNESAFKQELLLAIIAVPLLSIWSIPLIEKAILASSLLFVLFAEVVNTAIEATVDRIGTELHSLSGLAKDLGSAAVLIAIALASVLWLAVLFKHI
ncbi:MAG: diacylglycerol kinase [Pseudomonadota bacterium]